MIQSNSPALDHPTPEDASRFIIRGVHLNLTPALRQAAELKASRLLRHHDQIMRIRLDLELDKTHTATEAFIAKGRLEVRGADIVASAQSEDAYKSIDLLVAILDERLRRRHQKRVKTRNDPRRQKV